jgi:hypothetical protein
MRHPRAVRGAWSYPDSPVSRAGDRHAPHNPTPAGYVANRQRPLWREGNTDHAFFPAFLHL